MAANANPPVQALRHWITRFRIEHRRAKSGPFLDVPERVVAATRLAWTGIATAGPDQVVPGLHPVGQALVVRNLALDNTSHTPLVVVGGGSEFTRAYHRLESQLLGRWAASYPMYFLDAEAKIVPLNTRGVSRKHPPRPVVYRAFNVEHVAALLKKLPNARFLLLADRADEIPEPRPPNSHALLMGVYTRDLTSYDRIRRPCRVVEPSATATIVDHASVSPDVVDFVQSENNVRVARIIPNSLDSNDMDVARLDREYRGLVRTAWNGYPAFAALAHSLYYRVACEMFPPANAPSSEEFQATEAILSILRGFVLLGEEPPVPEARLFVSQARVVLDARRTHAPAKTTWLEAQLRNPELALPDLIVDSKYTAAWGKDALAGTRAHASRYVKVEPFTALKTPRPHTVVIATAPSSQLIQAIMSGASPEGRVLLYPWENGAYNGARGYLMKCAREAGVNWPAVPRAIDVPIELDQQAPSLVPRARSQIDIEGLLAEPENIVRASEVPTLLSDSDINEPRPMISVATPVAAHRFPKDRQVVVLRKSFHEIPASEIQVGDILVNYKGGAAPSAHDVVARVCQRVPTMEHTRAFAGLWRRVLRERRARDPHATIADLHRQLDPGVQYQQFRHWLLEGDPVTPERGNLVRLMLSLEQPKHMAAIVYKAGLDHKSDRRRIYQHILNLSQSRLDELFKGSDLDEVADEDNDISIEDLLAIVQFEKVTGVDYNAK